MRKKWIVRSADPEISSRLAAEMNMSPVLARVLVNRGITDPDSARHYLYGTIKDLHDPFKLKDMKSAAERVRRALQKKERILVYGDYDADGVTSCALLHRVFTSCGGNVSCYIPHRVDEGYGMNLEACRYIRKTGFGLVITVDCGIGSLEEVKFLREAGIDVIVTDHHQPRENLPKAYSVINPWRSDCSYPYKELAGVGLAFKLAQAVTGEDLDEYLDLVALGTVSDVAPLTGENRLMVRRGLEVLTNTDKHGLAALIEVVRLQKKQLQASHLGFILGPRINAVGRVGSAEKALNLLLSLNREESLVLATELDGHNRERQQIELKTFKQAMAQAEEINFKHSHTVVLHDDSWHPGVIGIVASRIAEKFYRPTILIATGNGKGKGSGRSIRNFHLFDALCKCKHLLEEFGGHEKAAGLSIQKENLADFKDFFNKTAQEVLTAEDFIPQIITDMEIPLSALSEGLIQEIERCAPFGQGNPSPVFISHDLKLRGQPKALRNNYFKLWLTDGDLTCESIVRGGELDLAGFDQGGVSAVYSPAMNHWQGISTIQLKLKDLTLTELARED